MTQALINVRVTLHEFLQSACQYTSLGKCRSVGMLNTYVTGSLSAAALTYGVNLTDRNDKGD